MASHYTEDEANDVLAYVSYLIGIMSLGDAFQVVLMHNTAEQFMEDDEAEVVAGIHTLDSKYTAQLYLSKTWMSQNIRTKTDSLVHELLHIQHKRLDCVTRDYIDGRSFGFNDKDRFDDQYTREVELLVDKLTGILVPLVLAFPVEYEVLPRVVMEGNHY